MDFQGIMNKLGDLAQAGVSKGKELAQAGMTKGRELAEIGKLKMANMGEQDAIRKAKLELGSLYFERFAATAEGDLAVLCEQIVAAEERIAFNNEKIADIKVSGGISDDDLDGIDLDIEVDIPPEDNCGCCCDDKKED